MKLWPLINYDYEIVTRSSRICILFYITRLDDNRLPVTKQYFKNKLPGKLIFAKNESYNSLPAVCFWELLYATSTIFPTFPAEYHSFLQIEYQFSLFQRLRDLIRYFLMEFYMSFYIFFITLLKTCHFYSTYDVRYVKINELRIKNLWCTCVTRTCKHLLFLIL